MKRIVKGDKVRIINGKNKGAEGIVIEVLNKNNTAIVEGVNKVKLHKKATQNQKGGIIEAERPINLSKIALLDPKAKGSVSKINYIFDKDNKKVRVTKQTKSEIIK